MPRTFLFRVATIVVVCAVRNIVAQDTITENPCSISQLCNLIDHFIKDGKAKDAVIKEKNDVIKEKNAEIMEHIETIHKKDLVITKLCTNITNTTPLIKSARCYTFELYLRYKLMTFEKKFGYNCKNVDDTSYKKFIAKYIPKENNSTDESIPIPEMRTGKHFRMILCILYSGEILDGDELGYIRAFLDGEDRRNKYYRFASQMNDLYSKVSKLVHADVKLGMARMTKETFDEMMILMDPNISEAVAIFYQATLTR